MLVIVMYVILQVVLSYVFLCFKQKTAYERRISDWSSDVCSSDLIVVQPGSGAFPLSGALVGLLAALLVAVIAILLRQIGRTEPAATTVFWFSALSLPPLGIVYLFNLDRKSVV